MTFSVDTVLSNVHSGMTAKQSASNVARKPTLSLTILLFYVNGTRIQLENPDPDLTLLQYLRHTGLKGTKLGCGEGGCGACTVMISSYDTATDSIRHIPVNACLAPLCAIDGKHIITVEGIGKSSNPHPVQERIALLHGSQCGFCTPGIVMSLYTLLRNNPEPTEADIEESFDGNLCRCTGYRPILDAAKTFVTSSCCKKDNTEKKTVGCGLADCCQLKESTNQNVDIAGMVKPVFKQYDASQEIIFPPALINYAKDTSDQGIRRRLEFNGKRTTWHRPANVDEVLALKHEHPNAKLIAGNTEIGVEIKFKHCHYPILIHVSDLPDLSSIKYTESGVQLGANVTLATMQAEFHRIVKTEAEERTETFKALLSNLEWFAGRQIRSVGTLAGNIATASPISDVNPILVVIQARLIVSSKSRGQREICMTEFFLGYRKTALAADEIILAVIIPFSRENEYVRAYKQARRKDDDIAIVNAAIRVQVCPDSQTIKDISIAYGGMGPTTVMAKTTAAALHQGKLGDQGLLDKATNILLQEELRLQASTPGGMPEYRMSLAASFLFRFWCDISNRLGVHLASEDISGIEEIRRGPSCGVQTYVNVQNLESVGKPMAHVSAMKQVTGEAVYTDDIPSIQGEAYAAFVRSTKAHAKLISVDATEALVQEGVYAFYTADDIRGTKNLLPAMGDEMLFAVDKVKYVGDSIGVIVAENQAVAQRAARMVKVEYEELPPIITIEEAIAADSFYEPVRRIIKGDVEEALAASDVILEGEYRIGSQEHFYLETHGCIAIPKGEDGEMELISCTQNPTEIQIITASVLGVPSSRIVCRVKRLGGGFGGKESRNTSVTAAVAVAAQNLGRPVRCMLDRDEDMSTTGQRHPFLGRWRVGVSRDGKIQAVDYQIYSNGGCTKDLSIAVMERALSHLDNIYHFPVVRAIGKVCQTNTPSNTAFRGFGGPQGMLITEAMIHQIADHLNIPVIDIQERNMYVEGQTTPFNQQVIGWHVPQMWEQLKKSSEYTKRREAVDAFNRTSKWKKRGLSLLGTKFGIAFGYLPLNQAGALVHIYHDGSVLLSHGGMEMGQGLHTKMIQVCAEYLRIPVSSVYISETATDKVANTSPSAASSSNLNGMAVRNACEKLAARLEPYRQKYPDAPFAEVVHKAYLDRVNLSANGFYKVPDIGYNWETQEGMLYFYFTQGTSISEVEVDILTGDHTILRTDLMMDIGKSLNYAIDVGQIEGALMQGIGWCTIEESLCLPNGQLFTRGPGAYKLPGFRDIPQDMRIHIFKDGNYDHLKTINSSKGIGEPPLFLGTTVIFAIRDALQSARRDAGCTDSLMLHSPATVERIRLASVDPIMTAARLNESDTGKPWLVAP